MNRELDKIESELDIFEEEFRTKFSKKIKIKGNNTLFVFRRILEGLKTETQETKQATLIAVKFVSKGSITKEEEKELRQQVYDILKTLGIGVPFALIPGASILIPILIKLAQKRGVNLLPSAFSENNNCGEENLSKE